MIVSMQSILIVAAPYAYISLQVVLLGQQSVGTVVADPRFSLLVSTIMMATQQAIGCAFHSGAVTAGKTCLVDRYINSTFETAPKNTIGVAFAAKKVFRSHLYSNSHFCNQLRT